MRGPGSKVVQLILCDPDEYGCHFEYIAICTDGSIWFFYPNNNPGKQFVLINELVGGFYQ